MTKKALLICGSELCNAGVPNVIMTIVRGFKAAYNFDIICFSEKTGEYDDEFCSYGGKIYRVSLQDYTKNKLLYPLRIFQIRKSIKEALDRTRYDVIHCNCGIDSGVCLYIAKRYRVPVRIAHAHGTYNRKGKNYVLNAILNSLTAYQDNSKIMVDVSTECYLRKMEMVYERSW